jgi:hypothetical protein
LRESLHAKLENNFDRRLGKTPIDQDLVEAQIQQGWLRRSVVITDVQCTILNILEALLTLPHFDLAVAYANRHGPLNDIVYDAGVVINLIAEVRESDFLLLHDVPE